MINKRLQNFDKDQEIVDGSLLIRAGILNNDDLTITVGWRRLKNIRGRGYADDILKRYRKKFEEESHLLVSPEGKS